MTITRISGVKKVGKYSRKSGMEVLVRWEKTWRNFAQRRAMTVKE
jgi:hypothetical protein